MSVLDDVQREREVPDWRLLTPEQIAALRDLVAAQGSGYASADSPLTVLLRADKLALFLHSAMNELERAARAGA